MFQIIPTLSRQDTLHPGITEEPRSWYHERVIGSDRLLITVGDSWTWGDALGKIFFGQPGSPRNINDDYDYRTTHIYGSLLADRLGTDFLNLARCGCANNWMYEQLAKYLPDLVKKYSKVTVIVTMTEIGRDSQSRYWTGPGTDMISFSAFLETMERATFRKFKEVFDQFPTVEFLVGRNFTFTFPANYQYCQQHLLKTWIEVIEEQQSIGTYPRNLRIMSGMAINPIKEIVNQYGLQNSFKEQMLEEFELVDRAITWLESSNLNSQWATKHPTEPAHKLWANYLYNTITNK
jgi:hypothetical protein